MRTERWVTIVTLALLQVFAVVAGAWVLTHDAGRLPIPIPLASPEPTPTPITTAGPVLAAEGDGPLPAKGTLTTLLGSAMGDPSLGDSVAGAVVDSTTGAVLFDARAGTGLTPASTTKVVTAVAALASLGPDTRLATTVVRTGNRIVLVGGGDPTLAGPEGAKEKIYPRPASLPSLASRTATALKAAGVRKVTLSYDASLFDGPLTGPGWKPSYIPEGSVAVVTALAMDEGRADPDDASRVADPPRTTAAMFAALLRKQGIKVGATIKPGKATGLELARVESPPVYALVERMLTLSDNDLAEALSRQVAIKEGQPHTFAGEVRAVRAVLARLGVDQGVDVNDGSGLSPRNRISPSALTRLLAVAASDQRLHSLIGGLPVAGFTGTLGSRYDKTDTRPGAGLVRAKTGTLDGVNTLAGIAYTADGRLLTFAFMADKVKDPGKAVTALDRMATIVSQCGCS